MIQTKIISGFPGVGKSSLFNNPEYAGMTILDSDSSTFDKNEFPQNYIKHIQDNIGVADIILVSSHKDVRTELESLGIKYHLVVPKSHLKNEYLERYKSRRSALGFISLLSNNWDEWVEDCISSEYAFIRLLNDGDYLTDVIQSILEPPKGCLLIELKPKGIIWEDLNHELIDEFEPENHVTVLYGLDEMNKTTKDLLSSKLSEMILPGILSGTKGTFEGERDVVKYTLDNKVLIAMNAMIRQYFSYTSDFPNYSPHVTVGYILPENTIAVLELIPDAMSFIPVNIKYTVERVELFRFEYLINE